MVGRENGPRSLALPQTLDLEVVDGGGSDSCWKKPTTAKNKHKCSILAVMEVIGGSSHNGPESPKVGIRVNVQFRRLWGWSTGGSSGSHHREPTTIEDECEHSILAVVRHG